MLRRASLASACVLVFLIVAGTSPPGVPASQDPPSAGETLKRLHSNQREWTRFIAAASSAHPAALKLANEVGPAADAGAAEELALALGAGLKRNAPLVLRTLRPPFSIDVVCAGVDVDDPAYGTKGRALRELELRQRAVSRIREAALLPARDACLNAIEAGRKQVVRWFAK